MVKHVFEKELSFRMPQETLGSCGYQCRELYQDMVVVGLCGCTASGKSTLLSRLQQVVATTVVSCDDFYLPPVQCPRFDLNGLPWAGGTPPEAFLKRGNADTNVPAAVDWSRVIEALDAAQQHMPPPSVVVDGLLLFGDHPGARQVLSLCDHTVVLWTDERASLELCQRKYTRAHLGKPSYQERGVAPDDYAAYWEGYVWPAWLEHGASRIPADALRLDCTQPTATQLDQLLGTGWFPPAAHTR